MKNMDELFCGIILSDKFLLALLLLYVAVEKFNNNHTVMLQTQGRLDNATIFTPL